MEPLVSQRLNEQQSDGAAYLRHALALNPLSGGRRNALRAVRLLEQASELDADDPIYLYWCGVIYRSFDLPEKAAEYFRRALERDSDHVASRLELAWVHVQSRNFEQARIVLSNMSAPGSAGVSQPVHDWRFHRLRAILLLEEGHSVEAFDAYPPNPPEDIHVSQWWREFLLMAEMAGVEAPEIVLQRLEVRKHELEMLFGSGDRLAQHVQELHYLWALLGRLAAACGDADKADNYRAMVPRASDAYQGVLAMSLRLTDQEARRAFQQGNLDVAIDLWRQALEEDPDNGLRRQWLVHALSRRGAELWDDGDVEGAVSLWSEARRYDASSAQLLHNLAIGFERLEQWAEANKCREAYLQSVNSQTSPDEESAVLHRGASLITMAENALRAGQPQEARRLLDTARPLVADDAQLLARAGLIYASVDDGDQALQSCMASLELEPGYEPAIHCLVHVGRIPSIKDSVFLDAMRRSLQGAAPDNAVFRHWRHRTLAYGRRALEANAADDAMEAFASLLLADASDIEGWLWAGATHMKRGNRSGAEDCFTEAIRLDPNRAGTYIELGARFLAEGDRERAESYFDQAVKASPGPHTHVTIGELCAHIGVPDLAEHHLRASLTGDKDAEPFLVRAICGLLETGHEERVRPFLEEAHKIAPDSVQLQILVAVQFLRHHGWSAADDSLREAQRLAEERDDETLLAHVAFFRQALILLRTVGKIDERAFQFQIKTLLEQWLAEATDVDSSPDELIVEPLETLLSKLPPAVDETPLLPPVPTEEDVGDEPRPNQVDLTVFLNTRVPPVGEPSTN